MKVYKKKIPKIQKVQNNYKFFDSMVDVYE